MPSPELPAAGENRFWRITHNPRSTTKPLTIELRQRAEGAPLPRGNTRGMSTLVGQGAAQAQPEAVHAEAERILVVAGRVDEFVGVHA